MFGFAFKFDQTILQSIRGDQYTAMESIRAVMVGGADSSEEITDGFFVCDTNDLAVVMDKFNKITALACFPAVATFRIFQITNMSKMNRKFPI